VQGEGFSVWLEGEVPLPAGVSSTFRVVLQAKAPYHVNPDYPHKFVPSTKGAGVTFPSRVLRGLVIDGNRGILAVPVTPIAPEPSFVRGEFSFSVCTETKCLLEKQDLAIDVSTSADG
jgi:hypothetical protein